MCGYCIEKLVLVGTAKGETYIQLGEIASAIYLQEADDLLAAVREIKKVCRAEKISSRIKLDRQIILARLLESLWRDGIESPRYERLAWNAAINQIMYRKEDPKTFADACTVFPLDFFQPINEPAIYMDRAKWELFVTEPNLIDHCRQLMNAYIHRWLHGVGLENFNRKDEVGYTLYNLPVLEWNRLQAALPAIIFSLNALAVTGEDEEITRAIITKEPVAARPIEASTLWLQRKAVELLYEAKGLSPFLPYDPNVRQVLIGHLAKKKMLHRFVKMRLAKSIRDITGGFADDDAEEMKILLS